MRYRIEHCCHFRYEGPVHEQHCETRMRPRETVYQRVLSHRIEVSPVSAPFEYVDAYGNSVQAFSIVPPHERLEIRFQAEVENVLENPFDFLSPSPDEERAELLGHLKQQPRLQDFVLSRSPQVPDATGFAPSRDWPRWEPKRQLVDAVQDAMAWIRSRLEYLPGSTEVHHPLTEVWERKAGVCQDFSHLLIAVVRGWGVPARYVMGYQFLTEVKERPATHAWTEIYLPVAGWRGFDATHQLLAGHAYIPVAVGRDSHDAAPQRGCYKGGAAGQVPEVELQVRQEQ